MNTTSISVQARTRAAINAVPLALEDLRLYAPAVFAPSAHETLSPNYTFIPTQRVVAGLMSAGFTVVGARQMKPRRKSALHAQHLIRLRRRFETVALRDCVPEVVLLNSHDGSSAYQLRAGLFRLVCLNGLMVSVGEIARVRVSHRGNVVDDVVTGALQMSEQFPLVASRVAQMESRVLTVEEKREFAVQALLLKFDRERALGIGAEQLLRPVRFEDTGRDLWSIYNVVQEHLIRGGLRRRSPSGRLGVSRAVSAIREDVNLNLQLWSLAESFLSR